VVEGLLNFFEQLGRALRDFNFIITIDGVPHFSRIWHLGGFGGIGNTPTVWADDLPTILAFFKKYKTSRSVNNSLQRLDFDPNSIKGLFYQPKVRPGVQGDA
jgi:hypothetical protein